MDDGKSTLIGRLLFESGGVFEDQLNSVRKVSSKGHVQPDLSLITDGLKTERQQAITIDVAHRYFATPRRKFIIADTPGHEQYTRNMATAASTADLAVLLVDVRKGVLDQTRRHAYIMWLLGIRHIVLAVNKMDLVSFRRDAFESICQDFTRAMPFLDCSVKEFVLLSALQGDNVVSSSRRMPWYEGLSLLRLLEMITMKTAEIFRISGFPCRL